MFGNSFKILKNYIKGFIILFFSLSVSANDTIKPDPTFIFADFNAITVRPKEAVIHINYPTEKNISFDKLSQYSLHMWNGACSSLNLDKALESKSYTGDWPDTNFSVDGFTEDGFFFQIPLTQEEGCFYFIVRDENLEKTPSANILYDLDLNSCRKINFDYNDKQPKSASECHFVNRPDIIDNSADWINENVIIWTSSVDLTNQKIKLFYSPEQIKLDANGIFDAPSLDLVLSELPQDIELADIPNIYKHIPFSFQTPISTEKIKELLKGDLVIASVDSNNKSQGATRIKKSNAIEFTYANMAKNLQYGIINENNNLSLRLWAPTAKNVKLFVYDENLAEKEEFLMNFESESGAWISEKIDYAAINNKPYRYEINIYNPLTNKVELFEVTDPYSVNTTNNSEYSMISDLNDKSTQPETWEKLKESKNWDAYSFNNEAILQLHTRELSLNDESNSYPGSYLSLSEKESKSFQSLKKLRDAGITTISLLPVIDFIGVNEDKTQQVNLTDKVSKLCDYNPAIRDDVSFSKYCTTNVSLAELMDLVQKDESPLNPLVQSLNTYVKDADGYDWGNRPLHFLNVEGSYAFNNPEDSKIKEFRTFVYNLKNDLDFNVILEVEFEHLAKLPDNQQQTLLDKIVPEYFQQQDVFTGMPVSSNCCISGNNQRIMYKKLLEDAFVFWANSYKVDGFRINSLKNFSPEEFSSIVKAVNDRLENDVLFLLGYDEEKSEIFRASALNVDIPTVLFMNSEYINLILGGNQNDTRDSLRANQGFSTGAIVQPNEFNPFVTTDEKNKVLIKEETIKHYLALNQLSKIVPSLNMLAMEFDNVTNTETIFLDAKSETGNIVNYASKHDTLTLFDSINYKVSGASSLNDRVRMQAISLSLIYLAKGTPFDEFGSKLLRSKSFDSFSSNSGDRFNNIHYHAKSNNFDIGLPNLEREGKNYHVMAAAKIDGGAEKANNEALALMETFYFELLSLRTNHLLPLLNEPHKISFLKANPSDKNGLILFAVNGTNNTQEKNNNSLIVIINSSPDIRTIDNFKGKAINLSAYQSSESQSSLAYGAKINEGIIKVNPWSVNIFTVEN